MSGGKLKGRKAFLSLLDRVRRGEVDVIAAYDQSRAFRKTRDALEFYGLLKGIDVESGVVAGCKLRPIHAALAEIIEQYRGSSPGGVRTRDLSLERAAS